LMVTGPPGGTVGTGVGPLDGDGEAAAMLGASLGAALWVLGVGVALPPQAARMRAGMARIVPYRWSLVRMVLLML
jgi:hypothetical protein